MKNTKQRYKYKFHTEVPDNLILDYEELSGKNPTKFSKEYEELKRDWRQYCVHYRTNPNHHFIIERGMRKNDKIFQIVEIQDNWHKHKDPYYPNFHITREIHKQGNHKFVEMAELYVCRDCGVYCRSRTSIHIPSNIWRGLSKEVFDIPIPSKTPK